MKGIINLDINDVAKLYNKFFCDIKSEAIKQRKVSGQISYSMIKSPWIRFSTTFKHGPNQNLSVPFTKCTLLNKNGVKGSECNVLAAAILLTWVRKENSTGKHLRALFQSEGIRIRTNNPSSTSSTVDLTSYPCPLHGSLMEDTQENSVATQE